MKPKQFESQTLVFSPEIWIQKYATKPQSETLFSLPHGAVETCRLPWRSTAEARGGAGGPRRLRRGRAAAAPSPGGRRAAAGPRAPRDARNGEQLGNRSAPPGEVQRGAADVLCCSHRGGWMMLHFVLGKVGNIAGKQQPHFQIISEFVIYVEVR